MTQWGVVPTKKELDDRKNRSPAILTKKYYLLDVGDKRRACYETPIMETHMHSNDERITIIYHGNCAFTHQLKPFTHFVLWKGYIDD